MEVKSPIRRKNTLTWINGIRARLGLEPVDHLYKGVRNAPDSCVIARTIVDDTPGLIARVWPSRRRGEGHVSVRFANDDASMHDLPESANVLAMEFDQGLHPDLEAGSEV